MENKNSINHENGNDANRLLVPVFSKQQKLEKWLKEKIEQAKNEGKEMFMGVPDEWYEQGLHCCNNGHIFSSYLKSELKGCVCFECLEPSHIFPTNTTQEELIEALS